MSYGSTQGSPCVKSMSQRASEGINLNDMGSYAFYQVLVIQQNRKFGNNQVITLASILQAILVKDTGEEHMRCAVESKNISL